MEIFDDRPVPSGQGWTLSDAGRLGDWAITKALAKNRADNTPMPDDELVASEALLAADAEALAAHALERGIAQDAVIRPFLKKPQTLGWLIDVEETGADDIKVFRLTQKYYFRGLVLTPDATVLATSEGPVTFKMNEYDEMVQRSKSKSIDSLDGKRRFVRDQRSAAPITRDDYKTPGMLSLLRYRLDQFAVRNELPKLARN